MNPDHIPVDAAVLIDANIILYALRGKSEQCRSLIRRCAGGEVNGIITSQVLAEITHWLMLAEACEFGWAGGSNPARRLAEKPERIKVLKRYEQAVTGILATGIRLEPVEKTDFFLMLKVQRESGLLTNDALLIACAERLRVQAVASADKHLEGVPGIVLYSPDDIHE